MRHGLWVLSIAVLGMGFACQPPAPPREAATQGFGKPVLLCELDDRQVDESSGLAASLRGAGVWYTHNDSGDAARFFRFDESGRVDAVFTLKDAEAVDWEDMASARVDGGDYLYFGDIGDNASRRNSIVVYRVREPDGSGRALDRFDRYELRYPDGARNAETLMVRPGTGDIVVVEKVGKGPSGVYLLDAPSSSGSYDLERIGEVDLPGAIEAARLVTGGDISPDGRRVVLRTYLGAFEYAVGEGGFASWTQAKPVPIVLLAELQGEAIAYSRDGRFLATTSELAPCRVGKVAIEGSSRSARAGPP